MISTALAIPLSEAPVAASASRRAPRDHDAALTLVPRSARPPVVATVGLGKTYRTGLRRRPRRALTEVTLWVESGEVFGLLGANGAGKTTLLKVLLGLVAPTAGEGQVLGLPLGDPDARRQIGYLPELPGFPDVLTPREWLEYTARLRGFAPRKARAAAADALERLGLNAHATTRFRSLSKGLVQRVGIAQAILGEPRFLVLDEPMSGLDPIGRAEVRDLLGELSGAGVTVLFSSHVLPDVHTLCSRVGILSAGRLIAAGPPDKAIPHENDDVEIVAGAGRTGQRLRRALETLDAQVTERPGGGLLVVVSRAGARAALRVLLENGCDVASLVPRGRALAQVLRGNGDVGVEEGVRRRESAS